MTRAYSLSSLHLLLSPVVKVVGTDFIYLKKMKARQGNTLFHLAQGVGGQPGVHSVFQARQGYKHSETPIQTSEGGRKEVMKA